MSIKFVDTAEPMNETGYPVARAKHIWFDDDVSLQDKLDNEELGGGDNSLTITQEEYDNLPIAEQLDGLYYTYDTKRIYKNGIQYGANEPIELTVDEFKALKEAGALDEKQEYIITTNENGVLLEASDIGYNGTTSGLSSLSVQGAIDEINDKIDNIIDDENVNENTVLSSKKTMEEITTRTANRQVKTFDNTSSSTEKWYKICPAITGGISCNIKLTASRADSTTTVQYFSALFRDNRYRYTSSYISRERTVYESMLIAEYSAYIIADANNDIWVHVPSYGKAIIEIDTRAIAIDGTAGTPVADYVYSSFEHQYDEKIDDASTNTTSTWSSSKIVSAIASTYLTKGIAASSENEKTVSFKVHKDYLSAYYAKRTFLLSANIYSLGFSKPVIGLVEVFRDSADNYGGYVVNLQDTRYTGVTVTVNGNYLEIVVSFNSYEGSGCTVACSSLSNAPIA